MLTFQSPWCLLALAIPILIRLVHWRRRPRPAAIAASSLDALRAARPSWRVRLRGLPMLLADLAFAALVVAIARPQHLLTTTRSDSASEGIAIEMLDCIIRILDWCGKEGVDVDALMSLKHEYNKTRPYRHGGKAL